MSEDFRLRMDQCLDFARESGLNLPEEVVFSRGCVAGLGKSAARLSQRKRVFLLTGRSFARSTGTAGTAVDYLRDEGFQSVSCFGFDGEPSVETVDEAVEECRRSNGDLVIGLGGGSVLDCAKAVAGMVCHKGSVADYLEGVGATTLKGKSIPWIAVPTVAGTGAEMTRNAVVTVRERRVKRSLRHQSIMARAAIIDPTLTATTPAIVTATSGMDAVTQLIESSISAKRRPDTTRLALEGLRVVREGLLRRHSHPDDLEAAERVSFAASLSGICLANSGLGLVHGIASGLGGHRDLPHGLICAILLPHALVFNREAAEPELEQALQAFVDAPGDSTAIDKGIRAIEHLNRIFNIPSDLKFLGLTESQIEEIARDSMGSSMAGNPTPMTVEKVVEFLRKVT